MQRDPDDEHHHADGRQAHAEQPERDAGDVVAKGIARGAVLPLWMSLIICLMKFRSATRERGEAREEEQQAYPDQPSCGRPE